MGLVAVAFPVVREEVLLVFEKEMSRVSHCCCMGAVESFYAEKEQGTRGGRGGTVFKEMFVVFCAERRMGN